MKKRQNWRGADERKPMTPEIISAIMSWGLAGFFLIFEFNLLFRTRAQREDWIEGGFTNKIWLG